MPNIQSAKKRVRQEIKAYARNHMVKSEVRTAITKARKVIAENAATAQQDVQHAISLLDRSASKGILHKNNAARRKSRLMKQLHAQTKEQQ